MTDRISEIRRLIDLYYEGASTPGDNARLSSLLAATPGLPPDLESERLMFAALADAIPEPPESLRDDIARIVAPARPRRRFRLLGFGGGAVAAAAVLIALLRPAMVAGRGANILTDDSEKLRCAEAAIALLQSESAQVGQQLTAIDSVLTTSRFIEELNR